MNDQPMTSCKLLKKPYTLSELRKMEANNEPITAVIALHCKYLHAGKNKIADKVSRLITGDSVLLDIYDYTLVGCNVDTQKIYVEVTGAVFGDFLDDLFSDDFKIDDDGEGDDGGEGSDDCKRDNDGQGVVEAEGHVDGLSDDDFMRLLEDM